MSAEFGALTIPQDAQPDDMVRAAIMTGLPQMLAAAGTNQSNAAPIVNITTIVSGADGTKGVVLTADPSGRTRIVTNSGTVYLFVYPPLGSAINDSPVNIPDLLFAGETRAYLTESSTQIITVGGKFDGLVCEERVFTESDGAGTYTGSVKLPPGATLIDVIVNGVALWTATTSATLNVGDGGSASGYFASVNLKATDLLVGDSLSFALAGGKAGAYIASSKVNPRYSAAARTISGVVVTVGAAGHAGVTRMSVIYSLNQNSIAAGKM